VLPSKQEALHSNPKTEKKGGRRKEEEKEEGGEEKEEILPLSRLNPWL
jgi:hypothetical protein